MKTRTARRRRLNPDFLWCIVDDPRSYAELADLLGDVTANYIGWVVEDGLKGVRYEADATIRRLARLVGVPVRQIFDPADDGVDR
jgi:hypothetical protein